MLVCNVSLRPPRAAIAAIITETTAAVDATATGNIVFATLVDDPASVGEIVDAYLGEIMLEAASASDITDCGFLQNAPINEAATAADTIGATVASVTYASLDGTATNVTLSNGNLTATHNSTATNSGARSTALKNSGKYYFEVNITHRASPDCVGVLTAAGTYTNYVNDGSNCAALYLGTGSIWSNNGGASLSLGSVADGNVVGIAVDLDNDRVWFRVAPSGNWNGQVIGSQNPATNTGGASISSYSGTTVAPAIGFGTGSVGENMTLNSGNSTFSGAVPSGFTSGWPA